jgi:acetyl-CoA carboxylase biotin carboxylase subunit
MFKRILIANRGEIALRVIRACRELGVETVAVFSEADRDAPYLQLADEAICIGPAKAADSYLRIDRVISAAEIGNVQAIHPGYGFLSENSHFAEVCRSCDIGFIGPTPEAMERVGDKNSARALAREAGVPTVPGSQGIIGSEQEAVKVAREIGFPVLLKATAGGGGKGMRVAANDLALASAWQQASAEAQAAFGNAGIYIEKYIERPRHVEIQILGDQHGNVFHLWERDCSTQRRHQKLIEESPSPRLPQAIRQKMADAAVRLAKTANYFSAGTVEFIVDQQDNFYFIEVNARIQVEHPVSEMVTGIDLLKAQIRVAAGEKLDLKQEDIEPRGHAIECRINAEDPAHNFRPNPGRIDRIIAPGGFGVRWDSHATTGYVVPPHYDSLVGKLIVHQATRKEAIDTMIRALKELRIEGIKTTVPLHLEVLANTAFHEAQVDTTFVERMLAG